MKKVLQISFLIFVFIGILQIKSVAQSNLLISGIVPKHVTCHGGNDAQLVVTASGGTPLYQFSIDGSFFSFSNTFFNLNAGQHEVTVKDSDGNQTNKTFTVNEPPKMNISYHYTNGRLTLTVFGGNVGYQYSLDGFNYQLQNTFKINESGWYNIKVKDALQCIEEYQNLYLEYEPLVIDKIEIIENTCPNKNSGQIKIQASGGAAPLTYSLDGINYYSDFIFSGYPGGKYTVIVKDLNDERVTQDIELIELEDLPELAINIDSVSISVEADSIFESFSLDNMIFQSSNEFHDLKDGTKYTIYAKTADGCIQSIEFFLPYTSFSCNYSAKLKCFDSQKIALQVQPMGGKGPYKILADSLTFQGLVANLPLWVDSVKVLDFNGLEFSLAINPIIPSELEIDYNIEYNTVKLLASGGTPAWRFSLTGTNYKASNKFKITKNGDYIGYVKDKNNCLAITDTFSVATVSSTNLSKEYKLFPNPTSGNLNLFTQEKLSDIMVFDQLGRGFQVETKYHGNEMILKTASLQSGLYFLKFTQKEQSYFLKFIKN